MTSKAQIEAWVLLVALSLATTALTLVDASGTSRFVTAAVIVILSGLKARTILGRYLQLANAPFWMRLFDFAIFGFLVLSFGLFAAAGES